MFFQWLRGVFGVSVKESPIILSEEAWRALLAPREINSIGSRHLSFYKPVSIPVGSTFMSIEDVQRRVDRHQYWRRQQLQDDAKNRKEWEKWQKDHPAPRQQERLFMIK